MVKISRSRLFLSLALLFPLSMAAQQVQPPPSARDHINIIQQVPQEQIVRDPHSLSNPQQLLVKHLDLSLSVDFEKRVLNGYALWQVQSASGAEDAPLILDTERLAIHGVSIPLKDGKWQPVKFELGQSDPILGAPLIIHLPAKATQVRIDYTTSPAASGLQWLTPAQTAGKRFPYLYTQSEAIHARSWVPTQDTPSVRITYSAKIRAPKGMLAIMSAAGNAQPQGPGIAGQSSGARTFLFHVEQPVPSYLVALAVGNLAFRPVGDRAGVYAEPEVVDACARELEDLPKMMAATEKLYGPYRWGRYDVLVLPPSFPYGGMENPRLTFASPTIIAGDKSLVSVITHELAHSWSGNLVTNATWNDFWLNEGVTTYIERRIVEAVYGKKRADMEAQLGREALNKMLKEFDARDQSLHMDLKGRDPDEGFTELPYEKGALFLRKLEEVFGRERFDAFLRGYFDHFAFRSISSAEFVKYLQEHLLSRQPELAAKIPVQEWIYQPGLPADAPSVHTDAFEKTEVQAKAFASGQAPASRLQSSGWSSPEWIHFIQSLPRDIGPQKMAQLDEQFHLTGTGNIEIAREWLLLAIHNKYEAAYPRLEKVLTTVGRRRIITPLYEALSKTPDGLKLAQRAYAQARPTYHTIVTKELDELLGWKGENETTEDTEKLKSTGMMLRLSLSERPAVYLRFITRRTASAMYGAVRPYFSIS